MRTYFQQHQGRSWFAFVVGAASICVGLAGCGNKNDAAEAANTNARPPVDEALPVLVEPAKIQTIAETVEGLGRCEALPDRIASLTPAVEGHVQDVLVKLGDHLTLGQPVVQLNKRIAQANKDEKVATRDGLKSSLALLKAPPRPEELKNQELAVEQAKVATEKAKLSAERLRPLMERKEISAAQMYEANNAFKQTELQQRAAEAQLTALKLGPRQEAIEEATSRITTAEATVETAQAQLELLTIKSPIDGTLDNLTCRLGQTVTVGAAIGEIVDTRRLHVVIWLPARDAARIKVGQKAQVRASGPAQPEEAPVEPPPAADAEKKDDQKDEPKKDEPKAKTESPVVAFVGRVADSQTGNLPVRILIDNADGRLHLGQSMAVSIIVHEKPDVLTIPVAALFDVGLGPMFNVVREGKSVRARPILGLRDKHWVEVISELDLSDDLKDGELIIVEGGYNLPQGNKVKTKPAPPGDSR